MQCRCKITQDGKKKLGWVVSNLMRTHLVQQCFSNLNDFTFKSNK